MLTNRECGLITATIPSSRVLLDKRLSYINIDDSIVCLMILRKRLRNDLQVLYTTLQK